MSEINQQQNGDRLEAVREAAIAIQQSKNVVMIQEMITVESVSSLGIFGSWKDHR